MARQVQSGQVGRASTSARLGAADPRLRRNAQLGTNRRDFGKGLTIDKRGKLAVEDQALTKRELEGVLAELLAPRGPLVLKNGVLTVKPAGTVAQLATGSTTADCVTKINEIVSDLIAGGFLEG